MLKTTLGQLLINEALPPQYRDHSRVLDKKGIADLMQRVATDDPDRYSEVVDKLMGVGRDVSTATGGFSFGLDDIRASAATKVSRRKIDDEVARIMADDSVAEKDKNGAIVAILRAAQKPMEDSVYAESIAEKNPLAYQILSGTRGNKMNLKSLRAGDMLYADHRDQDIPIPVTRSYSEGLTGAQYFAGAFGARSGVYNTKAATANAGFFSKQLSQATHRLLVSGKDAETDGDLPRGLPVDLDDADNEGALLAHPAGGYSRNTLLTPRVLKDLRGKGLTRILVRSPLVGGPADGGVYSRDVGVRERGGLSPIGDYVGLAASQALAEKLTQGQLCLDVTTEVRMADWSVREIRDIRVDDLVLGADKTGRTFPVRVVAVHDNGTRAVRRTTFKVGLTRRYIHLDSTADHKLLAIVNKWSQKAQAQNGTLQVLPVGMKTKDFSAVLSGTFQDAGDLQDDPFDLAIGLALGDGCYTENVNGALLSCFDPSLIVDLEPELSPLNLKLTKLQGHVGDYRFTQIVQAASARGTDGCVLPGYRNPMMKYLHAHGMHGKYAHEKEIPAAAYGWSNRAVARLIGGLCVTDGSVYVQAEQAGRSKPYIGFGSTSKVMAAQFRELLALRFGIYATPLSANNSARKRTLWSTIITTHDGIRRFAANIPLFGVKRPRLEGHLENWRTEKPMNHYRCVRKGFVELGERPTMDLEVDHPDHLFVLANGLVVSNSSKHSGGVSGEGKAVSGFAFINALIQAPKVFPGGAAHAQLDGRVTGIDEAPQGGHVVHVGGKEHYVPAGQRLLVKPGQEVEGGDVLSSGTPSPSQIVEHKGIGEGRRYFTKVFGDAFRGAGMGAHRRNVELVARGLINHVEMLEEAGDHIPGDVVPYQTLEASYVPRPGTVRMNPRASVGRHLEVPVLHHTIGTKIRAHMVPELEEHGVAALDVHPDPPPFRPRMVRGLDQMQHDPDWMTRHLGSNLQKGTLEAVHRGRSSDTQGTSFVPALARGVDFGKVGPTQGWKPEPAAAPAPSWKPGSILRGLGG